MVRIVHDAAGRLAGHPDDVVLEPLAARDLDVGQAQPDPGTRIQGALAVNDPAQGASVRGEGRTP
jgi:hypothetical protein